MKKSFLAILVVLGVLGVGYVVVVGRQKKTVVNDTREVVNLVDEKGKVVQAERLVGKVEEWNADNGVLLVKLDDSKQQYFELDPPKTLILIPEAGAKSRRMYMVNSRDHQHWSTAFCQKDLVTIGVKDGKVIGAENGGYRMCGLKE